MSDIPTPLQREAEQAWMVGLTRLTGPLLEAYEHSKWAHFDFINGFKAGAESRDQRIKDLELYVQHKPGCTHHWGAVHGFPHHCDCGLAHA